MYTIPPAVLAATDPLIAAAPLSGVLQGMLVGIVIALIAAAVVLRRAVEGLMAVARTVLGPPLTVFAVLLVLTLMMLAGFAGASP
ncbi:hypothetical protein MOQ72_08285 [Saccharopolyspora sp. K220]|uniref:hypothetical protein n=1 Tax=Saccharopolyspora soli TaxID=2926618 RepID=UPI001F58D061|nr:hypothetical protein [Saccharopolyspora soli]MCI2417420.1 hypothetical protein [Saccharopolyspora soli]